MSDLAERLNRFADSWGTTAAQIAKAPLAYSDLLNHAGIPWDQITPGILRDAAEFDQAWFARILDRVKALNALAFRIKRKKSGDICCEKPVCGDMLGDAQRNSKPSKPEDKQMLKVQYEDAVALMEELGYQKVEKWTEKKMLGTINGLADEDTSELKGPHKKLAKKILDALEDEEEVDVPFPDADDSDDDDDPPKGKKGKGKAKGGKKSKKGDDEDDDSDDSDDDDEDDDSEDDDSEDDDSEDDDSDDSDDDEDSDDSETVTTMNATALKLMERQVELLEGILVAVGGKSAAKGKPGRKAKAKAEESDDDDEDSDSDDDDDESESDGKGTLTEVNDAIKEIVEGVNSEKKALSPGDIVKKLKKQFGRREDKWLAEKVKKQVPSILKSRHKLNVKKTKDGKFYVAKK